MVKRAGVVGIHRSSQAVASLGIVLVAGLLGAFLATQYGADGALPREGVMGSRPSGGSEGTAELASPASDGTPVPEPTPSDGTAVPTSPAADGSELPASVEAVVVGFYRLVEQGDFAAAHSLFSARLRAEISRQALEERFSGPREFTVSAHVVEQQGDRATVAVDVVEAMSSGSQRLRGNWELVVADGRWLLDRVHL